MKTHTLALTLALLATPALADFSSDLAPFAGYTISGVKQVESWNDLNGKSGKGFKGCEIGRTIVFTDKKTLKCTTEKYSYSNKPQAVILQQGSTIKMVIKDKVYDMSR